jgi:hypothetical protein
MRVHSDYYNKLIPSLNINRNVARYLSLSLPLRLTFQNSIQGHSSSPHPRALLIASTRFHWPNSTGKFVYNNSLRNTMHSFPLYFSYAPLFSSALISNIVLFICVAINVCNSLFSELLSCFVAGRNREYKTLKFPWRVLRGPEIQTFVSGRLIYSCLSITSLCVRKWRIGTCPCVMNLSNQFPWNSSQTSRPYWTNICNQQPQDKRTERQRMDKPEMSLRKTGRSYYTSVYK